MKNCRFLYLYIFVFVSFLSSIGLGLNYGGFEDSEPNSSLDINTPVGWISEYYAEVLSNFKPDPNESGNWQIDPNVGLNPVEGNYFLRLRTDGSEGSPLYALAKQKVFLHSNQTISGYYFFGTYDWAEWNDFGYIKLVPDPNQGLSEIAIVEIDVNQIAPDSNENYPGGSTFGWQLFNYTLGPNDGGYYWLKLLVSDSNDSKVESFLAVDFLELCEVIDEDINTDCKVNLLDFSLIAKDWLADCNEIMDPNGITDTNHPSYCRCDIDDSNFVDVNDLELFSNKWLFDDN